MSRVAVFLDRDGTVVEDPGYLHQPDQLRLFPGAAQAINLLNRQGFQVILVTNQAGIGRGYYSEQDFWRVQARLDEALQCSAARVDAVYFCPHHPDVGCACRKPAPGMLLTAAAERAVELGRSYVIGDKWSDVAAGAAAGCRTVLLAPAGAPPGAPAAPHHVARDLWSAVQWVLNDCAGEEERRP